MSRSRPLAPSEQKKFISPEELAIVESLVAHLAEIIQAENLMLKKDTIVQTRSLATLILQIQLFMDQTLGEKTPRESRFMTKIPALCFRDFAHPNGALKHILSWSLEYRQQRQPEGRRFELLSDKNRPFAIGLCQMLSRRLKEEGLWQPPKVYFWEEHKFDSLQKLRQIVISHDGQIASSIADATHIILPEPIIDTADPEHYFRALEYRGNRVFAHWWYFPDSYDIWIPNSSQGSDNQIESIMTPADGKWKVGQDWLVLLEEFNEWMNEGDFEISDVPDALLIACGDAQLRNSNNPITKPIRPKRGRPSNAELVEKASGLSTPVGFRVRLGSGTGTTVEDLTASETMEEPQRKKRGRTSLQSSLAKPEAEDKPTDITRDKKRSKLSQYPSNTVFSDGNAFVAPGTFVLHMTAPGSSRGSSYDTLRSCHITSMSKRLQPLTSTEPLSPVDSDSEETAKVFLTNIKKTQHGYVEGEPKIFSSTSSAVSRSIRKKKSMGRSSPGISPRRTEPSIIQIKEDEGSSIVTSQQLQEPQPEKIAPGVIKHPPRSLQHSIVTASKDAFSTLRNVRPLDSESIATSRRIDVRLARQLARAEAATRAMMALWSTSLSLEYSHAAMTMGPEKNEPPDVPPITEAEISSLEQPVWLTSSNQHLSDFERQLLEYQESKSMAQDIDLVTDDLHELKFSQTIPAVLPSQTAKWFSMTSVHQIEKEQLKSVFFGQEFELEKIEAQYKEIRNAVIARYRLNPRRYLSLTDCRKFVEGDAALLLRIHVFLDFWGLINFQALPQTYPSCTRRARDFRMPPSSTSWLQAQLMSPSPQLQIPKSESGITQCIVCKKLCLYSYFVLKPSHAPGISVGLIQRGVWCVRCFANGRYPETLSQRQFMKVTIPFAGTHTGEPNEWTEDEIHKLIEGIEQSGENWDAVASHVGTRSPHECVAQFIKLPIEDPIIEMRKDNDKCKNEEKQKVSDLFKDAANPLLTQINFLKTLLGSECAAVSASAAAESLLEKFKPSILADAGDTEMNGEIENADLDRALSYEEIRQASKRAVDMAVKFARREAIKEEKKIRLLMRQVNDLKEKQIESKIEEFRKNEIMIGNASEDIKSKLELHLKARDELLSKFTVATEDNQKVLNEFNRERQQKFQLQQQLQQQQFQLQQQMLQQLHQQGVNPQLQANQQLLQAQTNPQLLQQQQALQAQAHQQLFQQQGVLQSQQYPK